MDQLTKNILSEAIRVLANYKGIDGHCVLISSDSVHWLEEAVKAKFGDLEYQEIIQIINE